MSERQKEVEIFSHLPPSSNPRVIKEAEALANAGFKVTAVTSALPGASRIPMSRSGAYGLRNLNERSSWWGLWRHRILKKCAPLWPRALRAQVDAYGSLFVDLVRYLQATNGQSVRIAHLEPAFLAALHVGGFGSICCDFEDWYSEDLLPGSRSPELIAALKHAEEAALKRSLGCWCTSQAMSSALSSAYGATEPLAVRNVFPRRLREGIDGRWKDRPDMARFVAENDPASPRPARAPVSFHWFSQTIGPGRGLADVFAALREVSGEWELHLRGGLGNYGRWLEEQCPSAVRRRLQIHALVSGEELTSRIAEHDVGLACESTTPRSRDVTITNKMFQYLQAGLLVVASNTAGQCDAAASAVGAVDLYPAGDNNKLRDLLQRLVLSADERQAKRRAAWAIGEALCWENEAPKLVDAVASAWQKRQGVQHGTREDRAFFNL